jgi:hypothetical protein
LARRADSGLYPQNSKVGRTRSGGALEQGAVVATKDGRFAYQVFTVCGEPRTLLTDSARGATRPAASVQDARGVVRRAGQGSSLGFSDVRPARGDVAFDDYVWNLLGAIVSATDVPVERPSLMGLAGAQANHLLGVLLHLRGRRRRCCAMKGRADALSAAMIQKPLAPNRPYNVPDSVTIAVAAPMATVP